MPPYLIEIPIKDRSQVALARRQAQRIAGDCGLSEEAAARAALATVEAATNILRHAESGTIVLNPGPPGAPHSLVLAAIDNGPGIRDLETALQDGQSTVGGIGGGLGAIRRMSSLLDIYTRPASGTVLTAVIGDSEAAHLDSAAGLLIPKSGLTACGDGWAVRHSAGQTWAMLADGLGHGEKAGQSAQVAIKAFHEAPLDALSPMMARLDTALTRERGAAILLARLCPGENAAEALGVGNVAGALLAPNGATQRLVSTGGVVGGGLRSLTPVTYELTPGSTLIMSTDGLRTIHDFTVWPGLMRHSPLGIAGVLLRDRNRGTDDSGVLVVKDAA